LLKEISLFEEETTTIHTRFAVYALVDAKKMKRKLGVLVTVLHPVKKCVRPVGYVMLGWVGL
jgi:hypothetical protein